MDPQDTSLKSLFIKAKIKQEGLDSQDPRSDEFKISLGEAIKALEECRDLISQMSLYSTNEEVDDISTVNLQYLGVDYTLAELLLKSYDADRLNQLQHASGLLESFLMRLDHYDLLSGPDRKLFERYRENRRSFSITLNASAEERRNIKVARFQEERDLKSKLKLLRAQSNANNVDDEVHRSLYLAEIALDIHQTFQAFDMISQELTILSQVRSAEPQPPPTSANDLRRRPGLGSEYSERLDGPDVMSRTGQSRGPLLDSKGKPLQPFTLTDRRTELQKGVFRPGHSLPTMSIDEYLEEERKRGGIIEGGGNANAPQVDLDEDNMELVDAATYKAREWDEFVEANPKGAGNTLNRG